MDLDRTRPIDRKTLLPYYAQLKQILIESVEDQRLKAGDRLPGDHELAEHFGLSRSVVRQAMAELETEGLVARQRGKGTYLAREKVSEGLAGWIGGLADDARRRGSRVTSRVVRCEVVPADSRVAGLLSLPERAPVVLLERVRSIDGEPWSHTTTWLPSSLVPGLEKEDFAEQSLYALLRERYGLVFGRVRRSIEATPAEESTARHLGIEPSDPVLRLSSVLMDTADVPIETFVAFHRGDRSRFDVELESDGSVGAPVAVRATAAPN
ncbi:GntR family transcriptional regulator [Propionicicella superfundia]|uniref:GntR family transcriptional regulator n=1 Tax=Propionicicella superfundia TaxID=348582 RepID=UPI000407FE93|nr:GntR family transcriptional regulator [Propionicicella superfundia]